MITFSIGNYFKTAFLFIILLTLFGCNTKESPSSSSSSACELSIGIINSNETPQGEELLRGYQMAIDEINSTNGINGCLLHPIIEDDQNNSITAEKSAQKLITQDKVALIIGTYRSENTLAIAKVCENAQIPLIASNATSELLTRMGFRWIFRIPAAEDLTILPFKWLETMFTQKAPPTIAILYELELTATDTASALLHEAAERGWSVVAYKKYYPNQSDYAELLLSINSSSPDVLFITGRYESDIQVILSQIREMQMKPKAIIGITGAFNDPNFYNLQSLPSDYIITAAQWHPLVHWKDEKGYSADQFASDFTHRYGVNPAGRSAQAYVAIQVAGAALSFAQQHNDMDSSQAIRQALLNMDKPSILGNIRFDNNGQNLHTPILLQKIKGKIEIIYPPDFQTAKGVLPIPYENITSYYEDSKDRAAKLSQENGEKTEAKTLHIGTQQSVSTFNPLWATLSNERFFLRQVYDTLFEIDQNGSYVPLLAQTVEQSQDGKTYIFTIPPNVMFHDGTPLTTEDVKFSYDLYHQFPSSARYQETKFFDSVQVINNTTIQLNLKKPVPEIADKLTNLYILPKHIWENHVENEANAKAYTNNPPIGSGPFMFVDQTPGVSITLRANKQHWKRPPKTDYMIWDIYTQQDQYLSAFKNGLVDMIDFVPPTALNSLKNYPNIQIISNIPARPSFVHLIINMIDPEQCTEPTGCNSHPALRDINVRQALAYAVNKEKIIQYSLLGNGVKGSSVIPNSLTFWHNDQLADDEYNIEKANQVLDQAGYLDINNDDIREMPDGTNSLIFKIFYPAGYPSYLYVKVVEILTEDFQRIGIALKPLAINEGDLVDIINPGFNHDLALWGWSVNPDPDFILSIFTSGQIRGYNSETGFSNPEYDLLYEEQATEMNRTKRKDIIWKMQDILQKNIPNIILYYNQESYAVRTDTLINWENQNQKIMPLYPGYLAQLDKQ